MIRIEVSHSKSCDKENTGHNVLKFDSNVLEAMGVCLAKEETSSKFHQ